MSDQISPPSPPSQRQKDRKTREKERLAQALRENLRRRKEQVRDRQAHDAPGAD